MSGYYRERLSANRLERVYAIAPPRVRQYLDAEIDHVRALVRESLRVTRPGGIALFSSYSDAFWEHRLEWFVLQAEAGLVGEIDWESTRDGTIACTDGFTATTVGAGRFTELVEKLGASARIVEIDSSSVFCEITAGVPTKKGSAP